MWEPTTKLGGKKVECSYHDCVDFNKNIFFYTNDSNSIRYFCDFHWDHITFLFTLISECLSCYRSHLAEFYKENRTLDTVKHNNKWWELCIRHKTIYEECVEFIFYSSFD